MSRPIYATDYTGGCRYELRFERDQLLSVVSLPFQPDEKLDELILAPGLVDLQVNGFHGVDFGDPACNPAQVQQLCEAMLATGVTRFCPTITTSTHERILASLGNIRDSRKQYPLVDRMVAGIHLEGPYISPADGPRGAHPLADCRPPNWEEFREYQEASGNSIQILTMSPEYEGSEQFIRRVAETGVIVSIGHTQADTRQINLAIKAGASMSTHLGNGAHATLPRHPNYLWDQLAQDELSAGVIADGFHLSRSVLKVIWRCKGPERFFLVSDLTGMAGMPPGEYSTCLGDVEVLEDGRLVVAGQRQYLAGANRTLLQSLETMVQWCGTTLDEAINAASLVPASLLTGLPQGWSPSPDCDMILLRKASGTGTQGQSEWQIEGTILDGQMHYSRPELAETPV
ncbi:MAG: amidohydrolase family protein [Pirellulaceae bacterium]